VSRPWSKSVRLRIEPGAVHATLSPSWITRRLRAAQNKAVPNTQRLAVRPDPSMEALARALDTVLLELAGAASLQGATLDAEVADALVHLDVVNGEFGGVSDRQLQSIATACAAELLGDAVAHHDIRWQLQTDEKHLLIGAIARELLTTVSQAAVRHGLPLHSLQPELCVQWNRHAGSALKPGRGVFAVVGGREAVIASVADGTITALSSGVWIDGRDAAATLDGRVDRLLASAGQDPAGQSSFVVVGSERSDKALSPRWTVKQRWAAVP
jgi:hypothetical protein